MLQAVDQTLDVIALAIQSPIKRAGGVFILLSGNGDANATPLQVPAIGSKCIAFVPRYALGTNALLATGPANGTLFEQLLGLGDLMPLPRREQKGDRLPLAITAQVDLRAKAALAAP